MFHSTKERASKSLRRLTTKSPSKSQQQKQQKCLDLPKKIIKALYDYRAKAPHELSFTKGDFFHVVNRENDQEYFEACNPASNLKGLVPVSYFQVIDRTERNLAVHRPISTSTTSTNTSDVDSGYSDISTQVKAKKRSQIYGVVMYDFKAERPDELDAQAGEAIVVISQSNHEWFIAKPIGRLGGPGLIPVSFVQVRDAQTDEVVVQDKLLFHLNKEEDEIYESRPLMIVNSVSVDSYILEGDQYWFVVYASVGNGLHRILYRLYEDFYDFQVNLMTLYPVEAGKPVGDRIHPFIPIPLAGVDEAITASRQIDLDQYCKSLLQLPSYLSHSDLVQNQLFGIHEGDIELDYDPRNNNSDAISTTASHTMSRSPSIVPTHSSYGQHIKVKIIHKDDIFAMKVPADCSLDYLRSKVYDRIGLKQTKLKYKNEASGQIEPLQSELDMEEAFVLAIQRGKITVLAE